MVLTLISQIAVGDRVRIHGPTRKGGTAKRPTDPVTYTVTGVHVAECYVTYDLQGEDGTTKESIFGRFLKVCAS